jgi:cyclic pyranopterin phosphate synthase
MGFEVKLNAVLFRGLNHGEAVDFLRFAENEGIPVRFLELMRIGPAHREQRSLFISSGEVIQALRDAGERLRPLPGPPDATAFEYATEGGGRVGFIASESQPFCAGCSRLRLSATGFLRGCLMQEDGLSLRGLPLSAYPSALDEVMGRKPLHRLPHTEQLMNRIGG